MATVRQRALLYYSGRYLMGVHGLTSFIKENRHSLSHTLELRDPHGHERSEGINLVVDGWSLIYAVFSDSGEPWVYGGEYAALGRHVEAIVSSWLLVGIRPTFVFDGPTPLLKYPTVVSRLQNNCVKPANLFFRTSTVARSTPRSLAENRIAPPLGYQAIISTLLCMGPDVKVELADGEADAYIVALAGRLGAYVTGSDSDFLVLTSEGYKGYIPLQEMTWIASVKDPDIQSPEPSTTGEEDDGLEFQTVTKKKNKGKSKMQETQMKLGTALLPPSMTSESELTLVLAVYEPNNFAQHLSLPPSLLPLLGALIGNDYASFEFFRSAESASQRVRRVANTLSSVLHEAQSMDPKRIRKVNRDGQGTVMDIIGTTVERLLLWRDPANPPASGQIDNITDMVVQSTLEYAAKNSTLLLGELHDQSENSGQGLTASSDTPNFAEQVRSLYVHSYRAGTLHPRIMETFARGSCFPRLFLEDPDRECCARSIGRPVREVIWSILDDGGGIPEGTESQNPDINGTDTQPELTDDDELVDVVEEVSDDDYDPLAALRGKLQRLSFSGTEEASGANDLSCPESDEPQTPISSLEAVKFPSQKVVTDYIRRGARVIGEDLEVRQLYHFLPEGWESTTPVQLNKTEDRLGIFLQLLGSNTHAIREIAAEESRDTLNPNRGGKLLLVVALRWVLKTLHARAEGVEDGNRRRERNKERWTRAEAQAFLASLYNEGELAEQPSIESRAIQLTAQALAALEACGWLAQALLLVDLPNERKLEDRDALPVVMGVAERMFSGRKFHAALASLRRDSGDAFRQLWNAVEENLEDMFGEEKEKNRKRERKDKRNARDDPNHVKMPVGMFGVLAGLETE